MNERRAIRRRVRRSLGEDGSFSEGGFTLVEVLTVMVIIAILAALTVGGAKYALGKSERSRTVGEINAIDTALEDYKADNGTFPVSPGGPGSSATLYTALTAGSKPYYTKFRPEQIKSGKIYDAFGYEYQYQSPGTHNTVTFDLWSGPGPDGKTSTAAEQSDDITNWQSH